MRLCGICHQPPRGDDPMTILQAEPAAQPTAQAFLVGLWGVLPEGTLTSFACRDCHARIDGRPLPEPRRYPVGSRIPLRPGSDGPINVCGICRLAMREGQEPACIRLGEWAAELRPGVYAACPECVERWKPRVKERLLEAGEPVGRLPLSAIRGDALL